MNQPYEPHPMGDMPAPEAAPERTLLARMLDPRSLQTLMTCGGGLLVLGLAVWLWTMGVFENRLIAASALGGLNLATLAGGVALIKRTRYTTAGQALTLLASLVLPLNLWFYDTQGLITVADGGHLWVPAVIVCSLYAGVAWLLKDSRFVYALVGGVTLTGMLFLGDHGVARFWEVLSPTILLTTIGLVCIAAERAFAPGEGPFSREKFGAAFFRAGHVVLGSGLALLLGARLVGWFHEPLVDWYGPIFGEGAFARSVVSTAPGAKFGSLAVVLTGAAAYVYSAFAKRKVTFAYSAAFCGVWSASIGLDLLGIQVTDTALVLAGSTIGLACLVTAWLRSATEGMLAKVGGVLLSVSVVAGLLLVGGRSIGDGLAWADAAMLAWQAVAMGVAAVFAPSMNVRRGFTVGAVTNVLATVLVVNSLVPLTFFQRTELLLATGGAALLVTGHLGWRREEGQGGSDPMVTLGLAVGSLLATFPVLWELLDLRLGGATQGWAWTLGHEVGVLLIGLALLGSGVLCRIRWTTLTGAATLAVYVGSLLCLVNFPDRLQSVAVYMMAGGAAFFTTAVLLSIYRERLLALPEKVKNGEGVFQVLSWR